MLLNAVWTYWTMVEGCSHSHATSRGESALTEKFKREALPEHGVFVGLPAYLSSCKRNLTQIVNVTPFGARRYLDLDPVTNQRYCSV